MIESEILKNIIENFSTENLILLFRKKSNKFRPINEEANQFNNEYFSNTFILGELILTNDEELVIYTFKTKKELTERSGKKAQYDLAKKILKQEQRYAAGFFIFYDDNNNFRFSFIYDIPQANGRRKWSNFRRFTYYVNKDEINKTFVYRLDAADFNSLEKIKEAFSVEKVTKEFYTEIANWYFWALKHVKFPKDAETEKNGKNIALIRFITRIIFIWFMKHKSLISTDLFDKNKIKKILKTISDKESTYYKAILQNLFFATLNTPIKERKFRKDQSFQGKNNHYMEHNYYRFHSLFNNPEDMLTIFKDIPFLNGGLFECLDKSKTDPSNNTNEEIRIDGFSDKEKNQTVFPNILFFSDEQDIDLNNDYGTAKKKFKTRGLLSILHSYNFTINENTPTDEEIALDPELLGRVFENLLASYNPETASTARKSTGSYYTPRDIVNFMVDESLVLYLKTKMLEGDKNFIQIGTQQIDMFGNSARDQLSLEQEHLPSRWIKKEEELEDELRKLVSYSEEAIDFKDEEIDILITSINKSKIIDPAVGSGAFPMGILHKLVLILSKLDPHNIKWKQQQINAIENNITDPRLKGQLIKKIEDNFARNELDYGRKLYLIQNCLYGVDIQPIAIQIAKLRFFISLLVDEKVQNSNNESDNFGIEPLPNLETKLVSANTLIGLSQALTLKSRELEKLENELFDLRKKYFITSSENVKKALEKKDRELRLKIKSLLNENQFSAELAEKISKWDPYNTNIAADWYDSEWMFGPDVKDGFNIIIANPPYIQLQKDSGRLAKIFAKQDYQCFEKTGDIYALFYEKGHLLLKQNGILCFITSNKWMRAGYGESLRKYLANKTNPILLIDFAGQKIFEAATVDTNILLFKKGNYNIPTRACTIKTNFKENLNVYIHENATSTKFPNGNSWVILSPIEQRIKEKIEKVGTPLKDWDVQIYRGILTGYNEAFIIDGKKKEELINQDPKSAEIIRPILRGRDIKRYGYEFADLWLINTHNGIKEKGIKPIEINNFPAIKKHLDKYWDKIKPRADQGDTPYNLRNCAYMEDFFRPKITYIEIMTDNPEDGYDFPCFSFDKRNYVALNTAYIMTGNIDELKYILGILNSKLGRLLVKYYVVQLQQRQFRMLNQYVMNFPLPKNIDVKPIALLVDKTIIEKKHLKDTKSIEKKIDDLIFQLFNFNSQEIEFIEIQ